MAHEKKVSGAALVAGLALLGNGIIDHETQHQEAYNEANAKEALRKAGVDQGLREIKENGVDEVAKIENGRADLRDCIIAVLPECSEGAKKLVRDKIDNKLDFTNAEFHHLSKEDVACIEEHSEEIRACVKVVIPQSESKK